MEVYPFPRKSMMPAAGSKDLVRDILVADMVESKADGVKEVRRKPKPNSPLLMLADDVY